MCRGSIIFGMPLLVEPESGDRVVATKEYCIPTRSPTEKRGKGPMPFILTKTPPNATLPSDVSVYMLCKFS